MHTHINMSCQSISHNHTLPPSLLFNPNFIAVRDQPRPARHVAGSRYVIVVVIVVDVVFLASTRRHNAVRCIFSCFQTCNSLWTTLKTYTPRKARDRIFTSSLLI